jgi:hypothetical protein
MNMKLVRMTLIISLISVYVLIGVCELWYKKYSTAAISFLLSAVNGLIYFG